MPQRGPQHHGDTETESQDQGPGHLSMPFRMIELLRSTNGGAVSEDLMCAILWRGRVVDDVQECARELFWRAIRKFGVRARRRVSDGYVLYQIYV